MIFNDEDAQKKFNASKFNVKKLLFLCLLVFLVSYFANMGWIRVIWGIPMILHSCLFYFSNSYYYKWNKEKEHAVLVNYGNCFTYILAYVLLPDMRDGPGAEIIFWGVRAYSKQTDLFFELSQIFFTLNCVMILGQIIYTVIVKCEIKRQDKPPLSE